MIKSIQPILTKVKQEIEEFYKDEMFDKEKPVTDWERSNTLDC